MTKVANKKKEKTGGGKRKKKYETPELIEHGVLSIVEGD